MLDLIRYQWLCAAIMLLLVSGAERISAAGFSVNGGAAQTDYVVGQNNCCSGDSVIASGTFGGAFAKNPGNVYYPELVLVSSNANVTSPGTQPYVTNTSTFTGSDSNTNTASINLLNTGSTSASATAYTNVFAVAVFCWAEGGSFTFTNTGTLTATGHCSLTPASCNVNTFGWMNGQGGSNLLDFHGSSCREDRQARPPNLPWRL